MGDIRETNRRILVVGASSKIAQRFIHAAPENYEIYGTYNGEPEKSLSLKRQHQVDLGNSAQINKFLENISTVTFDAALFFAASYSPDPENSDDYFAAYQRDLQLNAASIVAIAKGVELSSHSKIFLFGDAGLGHPKKGHTAYSISKFAVADIARLLAIELAPDTATFCLRLGPTMKDATSRNTSYYERSLLRVGRPVDGLVNLLHFLITESNFNATGCVIDYDGGAYIKRIGS